MQRLAALDYGRSVAALTDRHLEAARDFALASFKADPGPDSASLMLAVRTSLLLGDAHTARQLVAELDGAPGHVRVASRAEGRAGLAALAGDPDAHARWSAAWAGWADLALPFQQAQAGLVWLAQLGPTTPEAARAGAESREIFAGLGAAPFVAWMGELLADPDDAGTG